MQIQISYYANVKCIGTCMKLKDQKVVFINYEV